MADIVKTNTEESAANNNVAVDFSSEPVASEKTVTIVIPSLPNRAKATLLMVLSILRFVNRSFLNFRILLVGNSKLEIPDDIAENFRNDIGCLVDDMPFEWSADYSRDIAEMLKMVIADARVSEQFLFWPFGSFLIRSAAAHLLVPLHNGEMLPVNGYNGAANQTVADNTFRLLRGLSPYKRVLNYDCGAPVLMDKSLVVDVMQYTDGNDVNFINVYGNGCTLAGHPIKLDWKRDSMILPVVSKEPSADGFMNYVESKYMVSYLGEGPVPELIFTYVDGVINS